VIALRNVTPDAVPGLLGACDVGILPGTNAYGHPMKLVEYAAAGLACIAPDLPVVREVLENGITGLLFPPGDGEALCRRISEVLRHADFRRTLGDAARRRVARLAGWENRARALLTGLERSVA
jgi:glycosyltransferase involved in cell wall biosynthesis